MFTDAELHSYRQRRRAAAGAAARRGRFHLRRRDLAGVLDQRHRFGRMLRVLRRPVRREPLFRRRHRHRRAQGQRPAAAVAELGAVPALGKRPLHRSVAALFFRQPVLELRPSFRDASAATQSRNLEIPGLDAVASPRNDGPDRHFAFCRGSASFRGPGEPFQMSTIDLAVSPSDLRALAEQSNAWPFEQAKAIVARLKKKPEGRGAVRDRLRPVGPAAYRHLRRGRAHHHGAPRLSRADRGQDQDAAAGVLRRHGRPAQGAGQRAEQGDAGAASRQAADAGAGSVRHAYPSFGAHNNARLRAFLDTFGFDYEFASSTDYYTSGNFDAALLRMLERLRQGDGDHAAVACARSARRPIRRSCRSARAPAWCCRCRSSRTTSKAGTVSYDDPETKERVTLPVTGGHCKLQWKPDWAMRWFALGVDYEMAGKDLIELGQAVGQDLRGARRHAAGRLQLRTVPRRQGPEDFEVEGQRPDHRRMAALCLAGIAVAVHVPRAEGGEAAVFRRHPAQRRRLPAVPRRLFAAGCQAAARQSGLAHPCRQAAEGRHAGHVPAAADAGVVVERGECRNAVGFHRPLSSGRDAADPSEARRDGRLRHQLLSRLRGADEKIPRADRRRARRAAGSARCAVEHAGGIDARKTSRTWSTRSAAASRSSIR